MSQEAFFNTLWPTISVALITPLVQWLKGKLPGDWPIQPTLLTFIFNFLSIYALTELFKIEISIGDMLPYVTAGFAVSTATHSIVKSKQKNVISGGTS